MFSGEESYGKYFDLHANHTTYNNLKNIGKRIGYLQYLDALLVAENGLIHMDIPKETRLTRDYETYVSRIILCSFTCSKLPRYVGALHTYLKSFMGRTQPLVDIDSKQTAAIEEFSKKWEANELEGWTEASPKAPADGSVEGIWCTACTCSHNFVTRLVLPVCKAKRCTRNKRYTMPISLLKSISKPPPGKLRQTNLRLIQMVPLLRLHQPRMQSHRRISTAPLRC
jgi:hypothetical protein